MRRPVGIDHREMTEEDVRRAYDGLAVSFDRLEMLNRLMTGRARGRLYRSAHGRVLDVACGTGTNFRYIPGDAEYIGMDLSRRMLDRASDQLPNETRLLEMDAGTMAFNENVFDNVVSALSTCTFPKPSAALHEMARVCRPGGRVYLLEHGRSDVAVLTSSPP
ncbi:MAG: class I SAM-dependent methyltransferase [Haloarculaceae archaeon]